MFVFVCVLPTFSLSLSTTFFLYMTQSVDYFHKERGFFLQKTFS